MRILLLPRGLWKRLGLNVEQLRVILETKITIDDRRPITSFGNQNNKPASSSTVMQLLITGIMGAVLLLFLVLIPDDLVAYAMYFTALMCVLSLTLIADFSTVLLDTKDQFIILPRPVNDRTVSFARIMHIGILVMNHLLGLSIAGFVYTIVQYGPLGGIIFILQALISGVITVLGVNLFYLFFIRILSPQKLKDLVTYLQVIFSVSIFALYYMGPSLIATDWFQALTIESSLWTWIFPSVWVASLLMLINDGGVFLYWAFSILALLSPIISVWLIAYVFSSGFAEKMAGVGAGDTTDAVAHKEENPHDRSFSSRMAHIFTRTPLENAGFKIVWLITGRSRELKQKLYPSIGYFPVLIFFFFFTNRSSGNNASLTFSERIAGMKESGLYVTVLYFAMFTLITVIQLIRQSDKYKAAWVFYATPIRNKGEFMYGVIMASFVKFFFPFVIFFALCGIPLFGLNLLNDLLVFLGLTGVLIFLLTKLVYKGFPFSRPISNKDNQFIRTLFIMLPISFIGYLHYVFASNEVAIWIGVLVVWVSLVFMVRSVKRSSWDGLDDDVEEHVR